MTTKKMLDAIGMINDEAIRDAKEHKKSSVKLASRKWFKPSIVAACLCIIVAASMFINGLAPNIVSGPGLLVAEAYALSSNEEIELFEERELQEGVELPGEYGWSRAINSRPGLPLKLSIPEYPNATFDVTISDGQFILWELGGAAAYATQNITYLESSFSVDTDTTLYWSNMAVVQDTRTEERTTEQYMGTEAYATIVLRDGKNIVGYAVIKIYTADLDNEPAQHYQAIMLKSVSFPKIDGEYQNVTDKYVASEIGRIIAE